MTCRRQHDTEAEERACFWCWVEYLVEKGSRMNKLIDGEGKGERSTN